jgi:hypothetical protein
MAEHLFVQGTEQSHRYRGQSVPIRTQRMTRDRAAHGAYLEGQFSRAWTTAEHTGAPSTAVVVPQREGVYLEIISAANHSLKLESLENRTEGIRLRTVHMQDRGGQRLVIATVFVPHDARASFVQKLRAYATGLTPNGGIPQRDLVANIEDIVAATLKSFWPTVDQSRIPGDAPRWCEVWLDLPLPPHALEVEQRFRATAQSLQIEVADRRIVFPERVVLLIHANRAQLEAAIIASFQIAELRLASEPAGIWTRESPREQVDWARDVLGRMRPARADAPAVCILDTGITQAHPLLAPLTDSGDCLAAHATWKPHDDNGHGTQMAGLAAFGRLEPLLLVGGAFQVTHRLESVKLFHPDTPEDLYGDITSRAVSAIEIVQPQRQRVFCMAIAANSTPEFGKPSSWSASLDALASGSDDNHRRLFILAAGNVPETLWGFYPDANTTQQIDDPAQAWNVLTVGAYTDLVRYPAGDYPGHSLVAQPGSLSPYSATGALWQGTQWPSKPDIVMEGGNLLRSPAGDIVSSDDLDLLTTHHRPQDRTFTTTFMTSAACAQAANLAARIQAAYPAAWPETVRGLLVHSASWTDQMCRDFLGGDRRVDYRRLVQRVGFGVPDANRAIACGRNSLTLIAERTIIPFRKEGSVYKSNEMHLHALPWPKAALQTLPTTARATVRVTLSYFTEPNPSDRGWKTRYRYQGFGLRFALNRPGQTTSAFVATVSRAMMEDDDATIATRTVPDNRWLIGTQNRHRGTIHTDIWEGTAADVAACNDLAVYPVIGWWKERPHLGRGGRQARYALIVSIITDDQTVDIYTPVKVQVATQIVV